MKPVMLDTIAGDILVSAMGNKIDIDYLAADLRQKRSRIIDEFNRLKVMGVNIIRHGNDLFIDARDMPEMKKSVSTKLYTILMEHPGEWVESIVLYEGIGFGGGLNQYLKRVSAEFNVSIESRPGQYKAKEYRAIKNKESKDD